MMATNVPTFTSSLHAVASESNQIYAEFEDDWDTSNDLNADLDNVLSDFNFQGNYYYFSTDNNALNPGLTIEGVGLIGLPLSERDAKTIICHSAQGPTGESGDVVVDQAVKEVAPARVSFTNPRWQTFIKGLVSYTIPATLGLPATYSEPRCELQKLSLYQPGSLHLPREDVPKPDGTFATIVIVLPSSFEGGDVHLSHATQEAVRDISGHSAFSTSTLVWYTDVTQEFKPITSGYQLALWYNLVHTVPNESKPSLPDHSEGMEAMRRVLTKWKDGKYAELPSPGLVAYLLSDTYVSKDFELGLKCLSGADADKAIHLLLVAKELGFNVGLASLEVCVAGTADHYDEPKEYRDYRRYGGRGRSKRARWTSYDSEEESDDEEGWRMKQVKSEENKLSNLVCLADGKVLCLDPFEVKGESLVRTDTVKYSKPSRKNYRSGILKHYYDRSVLVLFPEKDETKILVKINGPVWATQALKESMDNPTAPRTQEIADSLLKNHLVDFSYIPPSLEVRASAALALMTYAVAVKDAALYNSALPFSHHALAPALDFTAIKEGLAVFGFPSLKAGLDVFVKQTYGIQARCGLVQAIETHVGGDGWVEELIMELISSHKIQPYAEDIPTLIWIAKKGLGILQTLLVRDILKEPGTYAFLILLVKALHEHRNEFPVAPVAPIDPGSTPSVVGAATLIRQCILAASQHWEAAPAAPSYCYSCRTEPPSAKEDRFCEIIDLCFVVQDLGPCTPLLAAILARKDRTLFAPLALKIKATLVKHATQITVEPFNSFFKHMMSQYLVHVLGNKTSTPPLNVKAKPIGCGCQDCKQLDAFLKDTLPSITFRFPIARRTHLEVRIQKGAVGHLVTYNTKRHETPHSLVVSKRPEVMAALTWKGRQVAAVTFVRNIGEGDMQAVLGAEKWMDLLKAVDGTHPFVPVPWDGVLPLAKGVVGLSTAATASVSTGAASGSGAAGVKRKQPDSTTSNAPIDLT